MAQTKYPTFYKVSFWEDTAKKTIKTQGMLFATSVSDAAQQLESYYGIQEIDAIKIFMLEENYLLEIREKELWAKLLAASSGEETL